jgi:deazaflavin-dependent oxidoreductase (nitroreductase family)
MTVEAFEAHPGRRTRPVLGLRRRPGRLALAVFRLPLPLYRAGWGWLLGHTFVLVVHAGRKTGQPHSMTAMVLGYDRASGEVVICSAWGMTTDWIRNIRVRPALRVQVGREAFTPQHRFLTDDESFAVAVDFRRRHPHRMRLIARVLGWGDLRSDAIVRDFVASHPFVAFRPAAEGVSPTNE